jgi:hypothetical protein
MSCYFVWISHFRVREAIIVVQTYLSGDVLLGNEGVQDSPR